MHHLLHLCLSVSFLVSLILFLNLINCIEFITLILCISISERPKPNCFIQISLTSNAKVFYRIDIVLLLSDASKFYFSLLNCSENGIFCLKMVDRTKFDSNQCNSFFFLDFIYWHANWHFFLISSFTIIHFQTCNSHYNFVDTYLDASTSNPLQLNSKWKYLC